MRTPARRAFAATVVLSSSLLAAVVWRTAAAQPAAADTPTYLTMAGRTSANPSVAARGNTVALTFSAVGAGGMDVFVAMSRDGGRTFDTPVQVNAQAGQARVSGEQPSRVALVPRGNALDVVVVWTVKQGADWQLLTARSRDGGRTFGAQAPVPGSAAAGARGWEAIDVDARGRVSVLWLDHRDGAPGASSPMTHTHTDAGKADAAKADPTERAKLSRLLYTTLDATGEAASITNSVCYCCKTALVHAGGRSYAAWRHVYAGGFRDIAFSLSRDGSTRFTAPVKVSDDQWQIDGCPDNGPALAVDARTATHVVHAVWPTAVTGSAGMRAELALYYATTTVGPSAATPRFSPRVKLPTSGMPSHPVVAMAGATPLAVWDEVVDGQRRLAAARVSANGAAIPVAVPGSGGRYYPTMASTTDGVVVAWVQQGGAGAPASATSIGVTRLPASR